MNKKIANVVFYKFWDPTTEGAMQQACIFYEDGTVLNTSHEEGLEAAYQLANADKMTGKEFRTILNNKKIFTLTGKEFEERFQEFVMVSRQSVQKDVDNEMDKVIAKKPTTALVAPQQKVTTPVVKPVVAPVVSPIEKPVVAPVEPKKQTVQPTRPITPVQETETKKPVVTPVVTPAVTPVVTPVQPSVKPEPKKETAEKPVVIPAYRPTETARAAEPVVTPVAEPTSVVYGPDGKPKTRADKAVEKAKPKKKKEGLWARFKKTKVGKRLTALLVAGAILIGGIGGYHFGKNNTKEGQIVNSSFSLLDVFKGEEAQDRAYLKLIKETKNKDQKEIMTMQGQTLDMINRDFALAHMEEGKDIKAGLTWDESIALNLAYNTYTKDQIRVMFNGAEVDSLAMSHAYKNGTLQLMGAFVIANRDEPVNMAGFVRDEEGKAFVEKYEDLFYKCKEAEGEERINAVHAFYQELYKDFPISDEIREEGLSHADARASVKPYMAAVTPMVAAAEIMFQNLEIDHTLADKATAYFNDIGLCNIAEDSFERAEQITLAAETDEKLPTYEEFRNAKIQELIIEGNYPLDDYHRDLSQLDEFQKWVNGYFLFDENGYITKTIVTTHTSTTYHTVTETHTTSDRDEAVKMAGEDKVSAAEKEADKKIEQENQAAKEKAEQEAEQKRQELQEEADREAERAEQEVEQDRQDYEDRIEDANDTIEQGGTVNEDDLGHGTNFDDQHSDSEGNLDDSVTDITTDGSGAVDADEPLPDPNEMGAQFDAGQTSTRTSESYSSQASSDYYDEGIVTYEEPYVPSNEEIVDQMIREMESQGQDETGYSYTK